MEEKPEVFKNVNCEAKDRLWKSFCDTLRDTAPTLFWQFHRQMEDCAANITTHDLADANGAVERIVAMKPARDPENRNPFPPNQEWYRAGKATWENAARFADDVYEGFQRKNKR